MQEFETIRLCICNHGLAFIYKEPLPKILPKIQQMQH